MATQAIKHSKYTKLGTRMTRILGLMLSGFILFSLAVTVQNQSAFAEGLKSYLDKPALNTTNTDAEIQNTVSADEKTPDKNNTTSKAVTESKSQTGNTDASPIKSTILDNPLLSGNMLKITELIVAGIVGAALIIALLVLFLGRWAGKREQKTLQTLREDAEKEFEHLTSASATVREKEKETLEIVESVRQQSNDFNNAQIQLLSQGDQLEEIVARAVIREKELSGISTEVTEQISKIQTYWAEQLEQTLTSISQVQKGLDSHLQSIEENFEHIANKKNMADELFEDILSRHNEQTQALANNNELSAKVNEHLAQTLEESEKLTNKLKNHQEKAETAFKQLQETLQDYESQTYEQFDGYFQVADLARQELNANMDESRKHIESMRRHEEQSHKLNQQSQKNLESLSFQKIAKLTHTIAETEDIFSALKDSFNSTESMLQTFKQDNAFSPLESTNTTTSETKVKKTSSASDDDKITTESEPLSEMEIRLDREASEEYPTVSYISRRNK